MAAGFPPRAVADAAGHSVLDGDDPITDDLAHAIGNPVSEIPRECEVYRCNAAGGLLSSQTHGQDHALKARRNGCLLFCGDGVHTKASPTSLACEYWLRCLIGLKNTSPPSV
jgi:hypothetical protein